MLLEQPKLHEYRAIPQVAQAPMGTVNMTLRNSVLLLGLSKGNFGFVFFPFSHSLQFFNQYACAKISLMSTWHGVMADGEEFMRCGRSAQILWTDTKRIQNVHTAFTVDPHKAEERFRNGLVRKPYERSLYERTFMSKP